MKPLISIIIPTWNHIDLTKRCYQSILANTRQPYEIIFVDNGSTDDTVEWTEMLTEYKPSANLGLQKVKLVKLEKAPNTSYAEACNAGVKVAEGDYYILMNNDVEVMTQYWTDKLLFATKNHKEIGVIAGTTNVVGNPLQWYPLIQEEWIPPLLKPAFIICDDVNFVYVLITKTCWDKVGGLDERYIKGQWEDTDFCWSARKNGFLVGISLFCFAKHAGSITVNDMHDVNKICTDNAQRFADKWGDGGWERIGPYAEVLKKKGGKGGL